MTRMSRRPWAAAWVVAVLAELVAVAAVAAGCDRRGASTTTVTIATTSASTSTGATGAATTTSISTASATASAAAAPTAAPTASADGGDDGPETVDDQPDEAEPADSFCAPPDPQLPPMELIKFMFTSGVEGKDPRDKLAIARPGQRVYSYFVMRNRSGRERCVKVELRVNGKRRTVLTLKVGKSWSWRTWGYNTLRHDDDGILAAVVRDDQGREITTRQLGIVPEKK